MKWHSDERKETYTGLYTRILCRRDDLRCMPQVLEPYSNKESRRRTAASIHFLDVALGSVSIGVKIFAGLDQKQYSFSSIVEFLVFGI